MEPSVRREGAGEKREEIIWAEVKAEILDVQGNKTTPADMVRQYEMIYRHPDR